MSGKEDEIVSAGGVCLNNLVFDGKKSWATVLETLIREYHNRKLSILLKL